MTVFTVYTPPNTEDRMRIEEAVFIPDTKSMVALIIPLAWLLWYRLWWAALFYALISIVLLAAVVTDIGLVALLLSFIPGLFLFLEGHELRRKALQRRGWKYQCITEGEDRDEAEIRYYYSIEQMTDQTMKTPSPKPRKQVFAADPGINLFAGPEGA